ncbi:XRE family transcriptional regulator [Hoyosella altamirensis]|uniref:Zn-dependent peptidase ImmA (M78 family)/transcriptional regulator with XRE-family HTH domain n=1 Tax=Hoyosella altamirensis TaxID=616997 RepID=A0A839RHP2_9ACTN|nr:XRE family transcriptional regulator [Hoyosella altamirensis]MBB3036282.1 Zn-dependent peptidase ImmA (M78 family)/transcriptional regulator with XRE-family HTH domain [Hoyosella altamirensis]
MRDDTPSLFDFPGSGQTNGRFEPARLTQARVRRSVTKTDLAAEVGVSPAAIGQYEAGVNSPRADVLERLAKALDVRPGFFGVGRPLARVDTVNAHFRSLRSARVSDRQKALATATLVWELTFVLERHVKLPEVDLPEVAPGSSPAEAAALLRRHWGLPDGPVKHLVATAESRGIVVAVRPLAEIDAVDAFSVVIVDRPIIVTTPRRTENVFRHRFSIAHEIGHLLLHADSGEHSAAIEKEADEFAAAFLTPAASMDAALPQRLEPAALDRLGRTWGVSATSLVRRMVERGRTTESSARRAYQRLSTIYDAKVDPTSAYPGEVPTLLRKAAELAGDHGAPLPVLAEALKISPAQVRDLLGEADERPVLRLVGSD